MDAQCWCPDCGPVEKIDTDGTCAGCGNTAVGPGATRALMALQDAEHLEAMGIESCDGTGWFRGDRTQTEGLERWARSKAKPISTDLWPFSCRNNRNPDQGVLL